MSDLEQAIPFGKEMRRAHFLFDDDYINLNQGAYGSHPRPVQTALRSFQDEAEAKPDKFIRYTFPRRLNEIRATLANVLNVATDELVIVPNATTGINTVLRNFTFKPGDKIVYFTTIYGAIEKTLQYLVESTPVQAVEVKISCPISDDDIIRRFRDTLEEHGSSVRIAIFDTIISMPGMRMPFERLSQVCRDFSVLSLIDAAHGIGHIPLNIGSFQPDFLVTNCHKWLFVPRACAVFYVPFRNQHLMRSSIPTSHGFIPLNKDSQKLIFNPMPVSDIKNIFAAQFEYTGTIDTAPILCIPAALKFRDEICGGAEKIRTYRFELAEKGEKIISEILGTKPLTVGNRSRVNFANVWLPLSVTSDDEPNTSGSIPRGDISAATDFMNRELVEEYNCYVAIMFYEGAWFTRFSAEIYLDLDDFIYGAEVLKKLCERVRNLEYKESSEKY
ncbi:pyridoxal phosphate-dependent transferase [Xylogone sp. PMI_703]|nr:pyridoxal phosphate-dependent transferase [Xylogone sp. PMI_703]